ncbi:MAG: DUF2842 domain-containing protein [Candidatus Puniceispirillaceae bacterium]
MKRWRHLVVALLTIPAFALYIGLVLVLSDYMTEIHWLIDMVFYILAGFAWIPLSVKVIDWLANHEAQ